MAKKKENVPAKAVESLFNKVSNLRQVRQFFLVYGNLTISDCQISNPPDFTLSWTHYLVLMRIKNADERRFYEIETTSGNWSVRELQRQYGSSLYNRLLQCYVLVDLKVDKLTHQDLGQMQMYVNYYDRYVKQDFEKPTIGILLCKEKKDTLVKLTLPDDANIYASAYELYLPDKKLLQAKVKEWVNEFESTNATCSRS